MAKAAFPIRLQEELMQAAELVAKRFHRSTAEQLEYWADLGRKVSTTLDPDTLLSISAGLTKIKTEPVYSSPIDADKVFQTLEQDRKAGLLQSTVTNSIRKYQVSAKHLGYLEKIDSDGKTTTGKFENGQFIALNELDYL